MRRYVSYLIIALLAFCLGSAAARIYDERVTQAVLTARPAQEPEFKQLATPLPAHTVSTYSTVNYEFHQY